MARGPLASGRKGWLAAAASGLSIVLIAGLIALVAGFWIYSAPGPSGATTVALLRKGSGVTEIGAELQRVGAVRSGALFAAAAQITGAGAKLKAGEYEFAARASLAEVIRKIRSGEVVRHHITIPEGLTSRQAVAILMKSDLLTGQVAAPPEGALLPETYEVTRGEERSAVLQRMIVAQDNLLKTLWARRQAGLPLATPAEAVTLASIVEKETAVPSERPKVAAVYVNRMRRGMRLEADPTVVYGVNGGEPLGRGLTETELLTPGPYNTYLMAGLPPTPIGNPGRAALAAVLDPPATEDIFFVANGQGGHVFAATYEAHLRNVARWREIERLRASQAALQKKAVPAVTPPKPPK